MNFIFDLTPSICQIDTGKSGRTVPLFCGSVRNFGSNADRKWTCFRKPCFVSRCNLLRYSIWFAAFTEKRKYTPRQGQAVMTLFCRCWSSHHYRKTSDSNLLLTWHQCLLQWCQDIYLPCYVIIHRRQSGADTLQMQSCRAGGTYESDMRQQCLGLLLGVKPYGDGMVLSSRLISDWCAWLGGVPDFARPVPRVPAWLARPDHGNFGKRQAQADVSLSGQEQETDKHHRRRLDI